MKSRQKGKKKGSSKERVFGCDLREHLQHSGQEGKGVNWNGAAGWLDCHAGTAYLLHWAESSCREGTMTGDPHP